MAQVRVLHVLNGLSSGGAETFIMNVYRNINRDKIQFDFLLRSMDGDSYSDEVKKLGGKLYYIPPFPNKFFANIKALNLFFRNHKEYKTVHVHANSLIYFFPLVYAKKHGVKTRIIHSHNTLASNKIATIIHIFLRSYVYRIATDKFACSNLAGKWMFGNRKYNVINNAIDIKKFSFNEEVRKKIRQELGIQKKIVIGHVGRFVPQKNHKFLLEIFKEVHKKNENTVLLLVGDGPLVEDVNNEIKDLKLESSVKLLGIRNDIPEVLQAFDVFLFPSVFEGLPFTLVEAQAAGLPCVISDTITDEVVITKNTTKVSFYERADKWSEKVLGITNFYNRSDVYDEVFNSGFDINFTSNQLEKIYLGK